MTATRAGIAVILFMVNWTGKVVVLTLAASLWATPLVACMLPDALLTDAERECCATMAGQCGGTAMPESHSCCQMTTVGVDPYLVGSRFAVAQLQPVTALFDATENIPQPEPFSSIESWADTHSPPVSPPESIVVLRI